MEINRGRLFIKERWFINSIITLSSESSSACNFIVEHIVYTFVTHAVCVYLRCSDFLLVCFFNFIPRKVKTTRSTVPIILKYRPIVTAAIIHLYKLNLFLYGDIMLFLRYRFKFFTCLSKNAANIFVTLMYELEQKSSLRIRTQEIAFSSSWISKFQRGRIPPDPPTNATSWASVSLRAGSAPKWQAEVSDPEIPFSVIGLSFTRIYFDSRFQSANFAAFQISFTLGEKLSPHRWVLLILPHTRETC